MEAKDIIPELRIGSLLNDREGNLCEVISLGKTDLYAPSINNPITKLPNEPIPLTDEWLLLFGFEKELNWKLSLDNFYFLELMRIGKEYSVFHEKKPSEEYAHKLVRIQYVHQLQNLFFALKGEELTIKQHA